jgi:transposase-like protein
MSQKRSLTSYQNGSQPSVHPDPEVVPKAKRRTFTAAYKLRILEEAEQCDQSGQIGALLRREGLYSSHLVTWRRQRATGQLAGLSPKKRGRKKNRQEAEIVALRKENERLRTQLEQAELIITAQKKLAEALERTLSRDEDERS